MLFRQLSNEEEIQFKTWASDNYVIGSEILEIWHPVIQKECQRINLFHSPSKTLAKTHKKGL